MKKEQKSAVVKQLVERFNRASIAFVSEYKGMTVGDSTELRRRLRAVRGELRVAKNTLIRRAIRGTAFAPLEAELGGPVGLVLSFADPVELAKAVTSFRELGDKFRLRGGVLEGRPLTAADIQALASLPPREVLIAQLLGLLQAPASRLLRVVNEPGSALARVVDAIGRKSGAAEAGAQAQSAPASGGTGA